MITSSLQQPSLILSHPPSSSFFFFNDTPTTEIYTLSLHDALPISLARATGQGPVDPARPAMARARAGCHVRARAIRSEEHTSELQSRLHLVCRLLLEKKKNCFVNTLIA